MAETRLSIRNQRDRDQALVEIHTRLGTLIDNDKDKETRIRKLERSRWIHSGIMTGLIGIVQTFGVPWNWKV